MFDAVSYGRDQSLQLLIAVKVNLEHANYRGDTALFAAARARHFSTFQSLIQPGANSKHENHKGESLEDVLSRSRKRSPIKEEMLQWLRSYKPRTIRKK